MIVPMKKAKLVVMKDDKDELLKSLQKAGVFMPIPLPEGETAGDAAQEEALLQRAEKSLELLKKFREKEGLVRSERVVEEEEFTKLDPLRQAMLSEIEETDMKIAELESENETLTEQINYFLPWRDLDIRLSELSGTKHSVFHTGFIKPARKDDLALAVLEAGGEYKELGLGADGLAILIVNYVHDDAEVMEKAKALGFLETNLPREERFVSEIISENEDKIKENLKEIERLQAKLEEFARESEKIEVLNDQLASIGALKKAPLKMTLETVYLEGWVRSDQTDKFKKAIARAMDLYDLELVDPSPEDKPPTYTKNNPLVTPFEAITDMFSRPSRYDVDPNPAMSFWFWMIFGMMMGDVGYGLLMFVLFLVLIKIRKPKGDSLKLFKLLLYSSITTIFWGVMFGSYFGYTINPILLEPMNNLTDYLVFSFVIGALHVITGILLAAYANIREGKWLDALFDQLSWILIILGLMLLLLTSIMPSLLGLDSIGNLDLSFLQKLEPAALPLMITGAAIILLTAGRNKKNIFGKVFGGFLELYNITGYASDILSYSRIMALSLSTAIIAYVMNILAEMVMGSFIGYFVAAVIYLIGHVFNLVMGLLSAYVHDSRLQYIEFFGKFYEGGGEKFVPLSYKLKYIDQIQDQDAKQEVY